MKKTKLSLLLAFMLALTLTLAACGSSNSSVAPWVAGSQSSAGVSYQKITPSQAKEFMDENSSYVLLDVRTNEEFKEMHIAGAVLIPDYEISSRAQSELPDKDALILIYCRSGRRSADAARQLIGMGYTNVYDFGGITSWPYGTTGS